LLPAAKLVASVLFIACISSAIAQTATITGLGNTFSALALSRNGQVVVGSDINTDMAAYWANGVLKDIPGVAAGSEAFSCNADGSVIVGKNNDLPFIWENNSSGGNLVALPVLAGTSFGYASLISANGSTVGGYCNGTPVVWTLAGIFPISAYPNAVLNEISDDGSTIACDLTGTYILTEGGFTGGFTAQNPGVIHVSGLGQTIAASSVSPFYVNLSDPDSDVQGYEDLLCLTADGSTQFGSSYDLFTQTFTPVGSGPYRNPESDGFWPVINNASGNGQFGNQANFEIRSCSADGSVLAGGYVKQDFNSDAFGNSELFLFQDLNPEISFGGTVQDLDQFLTQKGAATAGWTLSDLSTQAISADGSVILGAGSIANTSQSFIATVSPSVSALNPDQSSFVGGASVQATVSLDYPAPANTTVTVQSSNNTVVQPTSVAVPQGTMLGSFTLLSSAVTAPTTVQLTASIGSTSTMATVTVNPPPTPAITEFYPAAGTVVGGNTILGYVHLASAAGALGDVVTLSSDNANVQVPASAMVASGATVASFPITSTPLNAVTTATLQATLGSSTEYTVVTVIPPSVSLVRVAPSPVVGGVSTKVAMYLNGKAPTGGFAVSVASNNSLVTVPATITVLAGATAANATVTTKAVTSSTTVVVTAKTGSVTTETTMVLSPAVVYPAITSFYPSAGVIVGGNAATASVTLASAAGTGGDVVTLASNTAGVTVPSSVTVLAGKTSVSFSLSSTPVTAVTTVTLTATLGTSTIKTIVTVIPPSVSLVRVAPSPVVGGVSTKVAVYLNGQAPTGGFVVSVASNSLAAQVPTTITVPAGATAANATLTTSPVTSATTAVITAKTGSVSTLTTMVVNP
jgi:hypothetical protein